jgi:hypothetical protein
VDPEYGEDAVFLIPAEGGEPELVLDPPKHPRYICDPLYSGEDLSFVCFEILGTSSDAWFVENFDPDVN